MANEQVTKDFQERADAASAKSREAMKDFIETRTRFNKEGSTIINKLTQQDVDEKQKAATAAREAEVRELDRLKKWKEKNG